MPTNNSSLVPKSEQLQQQQEQRNSAAGQPLIPAAGSVTEEYQESLEGGSKTSSPLPDSDKRGPAFRPLVHQPQSKESPLIFEKSKLKRLRHSAIRDDGYCSSSSTPLSSEYVDHLGSTEGQTEVILADGVASTVPIVVDAKAADCKGGSVVPSGPHDSGDRPTWKNKADFLLSIIGFAVDLANVWRFPYLCYRNGGGVFLIPYLLMLVFGALPLFYMELVLGQYNRQGPISVWKLCPLFKGVGYCSVLVSWYVSFYYNVIIGWALYFMFSSFRAELPWARCGNPWNTPSCYSGTLDDNGTVQDDSMPIENRTSPALEFFNRAVLELHTSPGMHDLGVPKWQLLLCVMLVFVILYLALFKGVSSSGKVVWVTATAPYVILTLLLLRGVLLPGAGTGVKYYLQPNVDKLLETQVWVDAAVQVFYSVGVGFGVHLTYASYNPFHNNCYRDCLMTTAVNSFTSFYSGFVIFVYLGYMAAKQGVPIQTVATEGHGLVFQVYPEAIATLPGAPIWAVLFFIMLLTLGLDSAMGGLESVITGLMDEFKPFFSRWRCRREVFTAVVICASFCVSIVNVTRGGGYMITWFDTYSAGISLLCSALFESIGIAWFYGLDRFCGNINEMLGFRPGIFWRLCWKFITPTFLVAVILSGIVNQAPVEYHNYRYPTWAINMGWGLALSSVAMVPIVAAFKLCRAKGTCAEKLAYTITPASERQEEKEHGAVERFKLSHWTYV
ncbi:sodium-dependent dopamine transporter [Ixodes scapularis]|uniref:sodium-dependent dopamine transporter n=1 Tax=Ixodes scapularis TaxID=6945 RepID=UPI001A9E656C|nr:sodium-dependent dopamine transporter [Ixodes scapularis]